MEGRNLDPEIVRIRNDTALSREEKIDAILCILSRKGERVPDHLAPKDQTASVAFLQSRTRWKRAISNRKLRSRPGTDCSCLSGLTREQ